MTSRPARLILCADDYALAPGVSRAIVGLIAAGRLSATSCMTTTRFWPEHADWLRPHAETADIGLHLTLTDQTPLGVMTRICPDGRFPALGRLMAAAFARRLDLGEIAAELERQVDAFEAAFGRPPAYLDGHQHVHQLPGIRDAVVDLWRRRLAPKGAWLRSCVDTPAAILRRGAEPVKALIIAALGRGLRARARAAGIPVNDGFSGVHDFSGRVAYPRLFEKFVSAAHGRHLVMCHPGEVDDALRAADPVTAAREDELRFFAGPEFTAIMARSGLTLGRFA